LATLSATLTEVSRVFSQSQTECSECNSVKTSEGDSYIRCFESSSVSEVALSPTIIITLVDADEGEEVGLWNAGWLVQPHVAVSPKSFYWILSPRKLQGSLYSKRILKLVRVALL